MKKLILSTTFLIAGAVSMLSQGIVRFSVDPGETWGDSVDRLIYETQVGVDPVAKDTWAATLEQNVGGTWTQLGSPVNFIGDFPGFRGYWLDDGTLNRTLQGGVLPNQATQLRIGVIDTTRPAGQQLLAYSAPFSYTMLTSEPPSTKDVLMVNFRAFAVPEPSTIALGVLGLGALLLFRRRK